MELDELWSEMTQDLKVKTSTERPYVRIDLIDIPTPSSLTASVRAETPIASEVQPRQETHIEGEGEGEGVGDGEGSDDEWVKPDSVGDVGETMEMIEKKDKGKEKAPRTITAPASVASFNPAEVVRPSPSPSSLGLPP